MSAAYYPQVQKIYVAYYGRPADPAGLQYWAGQLAANGGNLTSIINAFGNSSESTALYAGASDSAKVTAIYQQLFNRAPDGPGLAFYTAELTAGRMTAASIALNVANGAQGTDLTFLNNKVTVGTAFTDALTVDGAAAVAYTGTTAITAARSLITGVTTSAATTNVASTITSIKSGGGATAGQTFTLTNSATADVLVLTAGNDTVTGGNGTIAATDVILDNSSTDFDVANLTSNTTAAAMRIQSVETLNVSGTYATTGIDVTNVTGARTLNLNTGLTGGTATVTGATSLSASSIVGGDNVTTLLDVTANASGTIDTVNVNGGSATTIRLTGGAGTDKFALTGVDDGATIDIETASEVDTYTITLTDGDYTIGGDAVKTVTIVANGDAVGIELTDDLVGTADGEDALVFSGTADVTVTTDDDADVAGGISITNTGSGTVIVDVEANIADTESLDFDEVQVDQLVLSGEMAAEATVTVNENTTLVLSENVMDTAGDQGTFDVDNAEGELAAGAGTLNLVIQETQAGGITTGEGVGTLILQADPDEAADTANDAVITITEDITLDDGTITIVFQGAADLTVGSVGGEDAIERTVSAVSMTGNLDIESYVMSGQVNLGSGDDVIAALGDIEAATLAVRAGAGDDSITVGNFEGTFQLYGQDGDDSIGGSTADDAMTLDGGAGNDTIVGGEGTDSITGGAGNDEINGNGGADTITTGAGSDIITVAVGDDGAGAERITDFAVGVDRLVLTGVAGEAIDLSDLSDPSAAGLYDIAGFDLILTGVSATDLRNSIQLGDDGAVLTVAAATAVVAGDFDDYLTTAGAGTVTGGGGADSLTFAAGVQTAVIAGGDSTVTNYDNITTFGDCADILDLDSATIADAEAEVNGTDVGIFKAHTVATGGAVSFHTAVEGTDITLSLTNFSLAVEYLEANIEDGDTVVFQFGGDSWVFQGDSEGDTLIRMVGVANAEDGVILVGTDAEAEDPFQIMLS